MIVKTQSRMKWFWSLFPPVVNNKRREKRKSIFQKEIIRAKPKISAFGVAKRKRGEGVLALLIVMTMMPVMM